jgi:hypothetical protein
MTTGNQVKVFVGTRVEGPDGAEGKANAWLEANPLIVVHGVHTATGSHNQVLLIVITVWFSGLASS